MIIDASALIAILREEPEGLALQQAIGLATHRRISAATYVEAGIVLDAARDPVVSAKLDELLQRTETEIVPLTESQARRARQAYRDFGKGSGHPARLNFGDCLTYALAIEFGEPLLYKGTDFAHTGIATP